MVWTPLPESTGNAIVRFFDGPAGLIAWRLFVLGLLALILLLAATSSGYLLAAIGTMMLFILLSDKVQAAIADLWDRNFYRWDG